jgi:uncharacterized protein
MSTVFADSFYYFALLNPDDEGHRRAADWTAGFDGSPVTTAWVLTEVADGMARPGLRQAFQNLYDGLLDDPQVFVEPPDQDLFDQGIALFLARPDKDWSLTDCISFVVMQRRRIPEALTGDHHFEQAGFAAPLK